MSGGEKAQIRSQMRRLRCNLPEEAQEKAADGVYERMMNLDAYRQAKTVMAYVAVRGELSLKKIMGDVLASGRALALPRCEGAGEMNACRVTEESQLKRGAYGILEPDESCPKISPEEIDLICVPGTAFDRTGGRIGQGGGYYDRYLKRTRAFRVGVCHEFALMDGLATEEHDMRMNAVVTPDETILMQEETT